MTYRHNGAYAALSVHYYLDDAIDECGEAAELLFVRGVAYCVATLSDGFISDRQIRRAVAIGLDHVEDRCKRLVEAGLWARDDDRNGFMVVNFLKWNRSREEVMMRRARDAARKRRDRSPDGVRADSAESPCQPHTDHTTHTENPTGPSGPVRSDSPRTGPPPGVVAELRAQLADSRARRRKGATS